ncbi:MAG: hypothetical protein U0350_08350 [Caldilineaceae bacterium]
MIGSSEFIRSLYPPHALIFSGMVQQITWYAESLRQGGHRPAAAVKAAQRQRTWLEIGVAMLIGLVAWPMSLLWRRSVQAA